MNASDLRIGNLVLYNPANYVQGLTMPAIIVMVTRIERDRLGYSSINPLHSVEMEGFIEYVNLPYLPYEYTEGIPLTKEWLTKAGFKMLAGTYSNGAIDVFPLEKDLFVLEIEGQSYGHEFSFLHQLQNLHFALTGEELDFKDSPCTA